MKKILFLVVINVVCALSVRAQLGYGKIEEVKALKERQLIVVMNELSDLQRKKYRKKPEKLKNTEEYYRYVNGHLQSAVPDFWNYSNQEILYKTPSQLEALKEQKAEQYAVLSFVVMETTEYAGGGYGSARFKVDSWKQSMMMVDLLENYDPNARYMTSKPIYFTNLPSIYPSKADIAFGTQMLQNYLEARLSGKKRDDVKEEIQEYAQVLESKTLLLATEDMKESLTAVDIKEAYPYPYEVVDYLTIEEAILSKDPTKAYVQILPMGVGNKTMFIHYVVEAGTGRVIGYSAPLVGIKGFTYGARIKSKHLKDYTRFVSQK